jgi:putative membrane protein
MWYWDGMHFWGGWGILGIILMVLFWAFIIWLIVWGVRKFGRRDYSTGGTTGSRTPLDIAKERYAKGEINREQFEEIKKNLQ